MNNPFAMGSEASGKPASPESYHIRPDLQNGQLINPRIIHLLGSILLVLMAAAIIFGLYLIFTS